MLEIGCRLLGHPVNKLVKFEMKILNSFSSWQTNTYYIVSSHIQLTKYFDLSRSSSGNIQYKKEEVLVHVLLNSLFFVFLGSFLCSVFEFVFSFQSPHCVHWGCIFAHVFSCDMCLDKNVFLVFLVQGLQFDFVVMFWYTTYIFFCLNV